MQDSGSQRTLDGSGDLTGSSDVLLEAGRADLYRTNAFRVTELPVDATTREIARQTEKLRLMERLGTAASKASGPLGLDPMPDENAIREAMQRLRDPERRLVDELFWFWPHQLGQSQRDEALAALARGEVPAATARWIQQEQGGSESNVSMHNLAVLYHARALDLEHAARTSQLPEEKSQERDRNWEQAFKRWRVLLEDEGFWSRLTARIWEMDDPRLTTGTARRIRASLPLALLSINAQLAVQAAEGGVTAEAQRHLGLLRGSGFAAGVVDEALRRALEPVRERMQTLGKTAEAEANAEPEHGDRATQRLLKQTQALLGVLDALLPAGNPLRDGTHDDVALRALGCQIPFGNKTENWRVSQELLQATLPIAASESARDRIEQNLKVVRANLEQANLWGTCWFCKQNKPYDANAVEVAMHGDVQRTPTWQGARITWQQTTIKVPRCKECHLAHQSTATGYRPAGWTPAPAAKTAATTYEFSPGEALRTPTMYFMWIAYALGTSAGLMVISQLVPFAHSKGVPLALATTAIFIGAAGNAAGRIFSGWLSDTLGRLNVLRLMIAISAIAMPILYKVSGNVALLYLMVFVVYYCYGTQLSVNASTTSDFWGTKNAGINYGLLFTAWGAAGIIGPRIGGVLFDKYKNYQAAFYWAAVLAVVALLCELAARRPKVPAARAA